MMWRNVHVSRSHAIDTSERVREGQRAGKSVGGSVAVSGRARVQHCTRMRRAAANRQEEGGRKGML
eukprot:27761-Eustigmatos_ZCMA.PRE.1